MQKDIDIFQNQLRSGTSNALNNLSNVVTIPNNILQGQFKEAGINTLRFSINTTLGIAGIFDVASYYGLKKLDKEDYGQTLGTWGVKEGCYFVFTSFGSNNCKRHFRFNWLIFQVEMLGTMLQLQMIQIFENSDYYYSRLTAGVDFRAKNLEAFDSLEKKFIRFLCICKKFYLQDRKRKIKIQMKLQKQ